MRDLILLNPSLDRVDVATLVKGVKICVRIRVASKPHGRNHADVSVAHDVLTERLDAMLCISLQ
jgi:hypothetical protein